MPKSFARRARVLAPVLMAAIAGCASKSDAQAGNPQSTDARARMAVLTPATRPATEPTTQSAPVLDTPPDYSAFTETAKIPFTRGTRFNNLTGMSVRVSFDGGPTRTLQVDTGSVGVIVSALEIKNIAPDAEKGNITYSSSGVSIDGLWTPVKITFVDSKGPDGKPVSAVVPVMAATSRRVLPGAVNSTTRPNASQPVANPKVWMFGVGFDRGKDPRQERNPFVNLEAMVAGTMRRGYTITRDGYTLGLSKAAVGDGYVYEKLKQKAPSTQMATMRPGLKDWESPSAWTTIDGVDGPMGTALLDTGLTNMMIGNPAHTQADVPDGTPITVHLMKGLLSYTFNVGDKTNVTTPRRVTKTVRPFVYNNTGLKALSVFDYLYDADGGYFGLRPTKPLPATQPATRRATTAPTPTP